jgi:hypothetical protein
VRHGSFLYLAKLVCLSDFPKLISNGEFQFDDPDALIRRNTHQIFSRSTVAYQGRYTFGFLEGRARFISRYRR